MTMLKESITESANYDLERITKDRVEPEQERYYTVGTVVTHGIDSTGHKPGIDSGFTISARIHPRSESDVYKLDALITYSITTAVDGVCVSVELHTHRAGL